MTGYPVSQNWTATTSTVNPWSSWNITYTVTGSSLTGSTTGTLVTNAVTWGAWNNSLITNYACGSGCTMTASWTSWNDLYAAQAAANVLAGRKPTKVELKAEAERKKTIEANRLEQLRIHEERRARLVVEVAAARRRAGDLLHRSLSPEQREDLEKKNCFYLESVSPTGERRRYRIDRGTHGNVALLDSKGSVLGTYCIQPNGVPVEDAMLAQKLWLETDEKTFIKVANYTPRRAAA